MKITFQSRLRNSTKFSSTPVFCCWIAKGLDRFSHQLDLQSQLKSSIHRCWPLSLRTKTHTRLQAHLQRSEKKRDLSRLVSPPAQKANTLYLVASLGITSWQHLARSAVEENVRRASNNVLLRVLWQDFANQTECFLIAGREVLHLHGAELEERILQRSMQCKQFELFELNSPGTVTGSSGGSTDSERRCP